MNFLKPTLHSVPLTYGSVATVPIFDVKALLIVFLNDPLRMCQENFASNNDIFTGKAKFLTSTLDEIHTGFIRRPNMTDSSHYSYQIVLMFTLGHSYLWSKLSQFKFKHKWTVPKLNVHTVCLMCLFGSIWTLAC